MREKIAIVAVSSIILILLFTRYVILDGLNTEGGTLLKLQTQVKDLKKQNILLEQTVLKKKSFIYIQEKAFVTGFIPAQYVVLGRKK